MPELPDILVYISALEKRILGKELIQISIDHPFFLRSVEPLPLEIHGHKVVSIRNLGKRIALGFDNEIWCVIHLMIAGRLQWLDPNKKPPLKRTLAGFRFSAGTLTVTEAGSKRRASLHIVRGNDSISEFDRGGRNVFDLSFDEFNRILIKENHTLKRALTDPRFFSGIGNAYSDEILHRARLSPIMLTRTVDSTQVQRLFDAVKTVLSEWIDILRKETGSGFPKKVTAFRPEMAVHGKFGKPCPVCSAPVQRIRYASNETNYCPRCQTGGKILADRSLSRILKDDWPRSIDEL